MGRLVLRLLAAALVAVFAVPAAAADAAKRPDLRVTKLKPDARTVQAGGSLLLRTTVRNSGRRRAKPTQLEVYVSHNSQLTRADQRLASRRIGKLKSRRSRRAALPVDLPVTVPAGRRYLFACADARKQVRESRESNNCRRVALKVVAPLPAPVPTPTATPTPLATPTPDPPDERAPQVSAVTSDTANGFYRAGSEISILVRFDEPVTVSGTPVLQLETGLVDREATFAGGSGTAALEFTYDVQPGDATDDLDYAAPSSLLASGATLRDVAGNDADLTLPAPGAPGSLRAAKALGIDTAAPAPAGADSPTADGAYNAGRTILITVDFGEPVLVTGRPTLLLETGADDAVASYASGSGTSGLTFEYLVGPGETTQDLDYSGSDAISLAGGTIRDRAGNPAGLVLPAPGSPGSLGHARALRIDTGAPVVTGVDSTKLDGPYGPGEVIPIRVTFSEPVSVSGTPLLALETGDADRSAIYSGGSGTTVLTFSYTVVAPDTTPDLDYRDAAALSGSIRDAASNAAVLALPAPGQPGSLGAARALRIDTAAPTVTGVAATTPNGIYGDGESVAITVAFSEPVFVDGAPRLELETGLTDNQAVFSSGSGTSTLVFTYAVRQGDDNPDLDYTSTGALTLAGGAIRDSARNAAQLTLPSPGAAGSLSNGRSIALDTRAPTVFSLGSPTADGSYTAGEVIPITVTFSEPVLVAGTPQLKLETGRNDRIATYLSGSGTSTLTFRYVVQPDDISPDLDHHGTDALTLPGATIRDAKGHDAVLDLPRPGEAGSLAAGKALVILDTSPPRVLNATSPETGGRYKAGSVIPIVLTFNEPVAVTGAPVLTLETGADDGTAVYGSGSATDALTFLYTVADGHTAGDLDYASANALTGGTIVDPSANAANRLLPAPGAPGSLAANEALVIDTTAPVVTGVTSSRPNGTYSPGTVIPVQVSFSEPVVVAGTPTLAIETGAIDRLAEYASGSGTQTLTFNYTVLSGDTATDLDYTSAGALAQPDGARIDDAAGNQATLTLPDPGAAGSLGANKDIALDTTPPRVTGVGSDFANGTYGSGTVIAIIVSFDDAVVVTGTPTLAMAVGGGATRAATYESGSGTSKLTFKYVAGLGDFSSDLEYASRTALSLSGGSIRDAAGNQAALTLPATGAAGSLSHAKAIVIDGVAPRVTSVSSPTANGTYVAADVVQVSVTFTEAVQVTGTPQILLETGSVDRTATYESGSGTSTLLFSYTVVVGDDTADLDYKDSSALTSGTIADLVGNAAVRTLPDPGTAGSLGANKAIVING